MYYDALLYGNKEHLNSKSFQALKDLRQEAFREAAIFRLKEQNEGVNRVFRSLEIYVKVVINFMS